MGQTVHQIEDHIESSREDLRSNLEELGQRAKSAVDWRERFRTNPGALLAVAFGGGFILANVTGASRRRRIEPNISPAAPALAVEDRKGHALRACDDILGALVGVVAAKVTDTLADVIPGFKEQVAARKDDARVHNGTPGTH